MKITVTQSFNLTEALDSPVRINFLTRKGGVDEESFTKFRDVELKGKAQTYSTGLMTKTYTVESTKTITYYSRWLTEADLTRMEDLMESPYILVNGKPVNVLDRSLKVDNISRLFSIELTVTSEYGQNRITF